MKIKVNDYEQHKDNLQECLRMIKEDLERYGVTFDDFTIYLTTYNMETHKPCDLVVKATNEEANMILDDETLKHKRAEKIDQVNNTIIYNFTGKNFPSSKTKNKKRV